MVSGGYQGSAEPTRVWAVHAEVVLCSWGSTAVGEQLRRDEPKAARAHFPGGGAGVVLRCWVRSDGCKTAGCLRSVETKALELILSPLTAICQVTVVSHNAVGDACVP